MPTKPNDVEIALAHHWLVQMLGGEKVLGELLEMVFTLKLHRLRLLARNQYDRVHAHFSLNGFCGRFISLIRPNTVVPE